MRIYKTILSILERRGPLPLPSICDEVNLTLEAQRQKPLVPSQIKSIVSKKSEFFCVNGENISIDPAKIPYSLTAYLDCFGDISYHVRVHFLTNNFISWEWRNRDSTKQFTNLHSIKPGSTDELKYSLFSLKIWDWEPVYRKEEGIILDGKYWSVVLKTKEKIYQFEGIESFPANWGRFCNAIEKLTGTPFR